MKKIALALVITFLSAAGSKASPALVKQYDDWGLYAFEKGSRTLCYVLSVPVHERPAGVDHGRNFFMIGHSLQASDRYEPQVRMGYPLQEGSLVLIRIDGNTFRMFSKGDTAWIVREAREPAMISAMRNGRDMTVEAVSARGTKTSYTYSLRGIAAGLKAAEGKRCR